MIKFKRETTIQWSYHNTRNLRVLGVYCISIFCTTHTKAIPMIKFKHEATIQWSYHNTRNLRVLGVYCISLFVQHTERQSLVRVDAVRAPRGGQARIHGYYDSHVKSTECCSIILASLPRNIWV